MHSATFHSSQNERLLFSSWILYPGKATFFAGLAMVAVAFFFQAIKLIRMKLGRGCPNMACKRYILNKTHLLQTVLFVVQFVVGYFLMLAVMTYNIWIVVAAVMGLGLAYFFMGWAEHDEAAKCKVLHTASRSCGGHSSKSQVIQELQPLSEESGPESGGTSSSHLACNCGEARL